MIDTSKSNYVHIIGKIIEEPKFHHEFLGEKFLEATLSTMRSSGVIDKINLIIPSRKLGDDIMTNDSVEIFGEIRSHNMHETESYKVLVFAYCQEILYNIKNNRDINEVLFKGTLVTKPNYRTTPRGREVSNLTIAINRGYNKSSYIPAICWGSFARESQRFKVGDEFICNGRLQSRNYIKDDIMNTAYEVSLSTILHN